MMTIENKVSMLNKRIKQLEKDKEDLGVLALKQSLIAEDLREVSKGMAAELKDGMRANMIGFFGFMILMAIFSASVTDMLHNRYIDQYVKPLINNNSECVDDSK